MGLFSSKHTSRIGLDISEDAIRLLQLEFNGSHLHVKAACQWELPEEIREENRRTYRWYHYCVNTIRRLIQENGFKGRSVRVSFSFDQLEYAILQIYKSVDPNIDEMVRSQARDHFGFEEHYGTVDYWESGDVGNTNNSYQQFIVFGASDYILQNTLLMLEDMHLSCAGIEPMPCALFRSVRNPWSDHDFGRSTVMVDVGFSYSVIMTGMGRFMTGIKRVDYGAKDFNDSRPSSFDFLVNPQEELVKKILDCLNYHQTVFQGERPEILILTGYPVKTELNQFLQEKTACKVNSYPFFAGMDCAKVEMVGGQGNDASRWAVGLGLCLKDYVSDKVAVG
jgi:Tfp pilus assembly PilM family ATPase